MGIYESPKYSVVIKEKNIEIRSYESFNIVLYENPRDRNADSGFNTLFSYISKGNKREEKIKMTVPVLEEDRGGLRTLSFVVPSKYNLEDIPAPKSDLIRVDKIDGGYFACIRYSGLATEGSYKKNLDKLINFLKEKNYNISSEFYRAYYDPPFQLPFLRRNEILVRLTNISKERLIAR